MQGACEWDAACNGEGREGRGGGGTDGEGETDEESDGEGGMSVASLLAEEEESNVWMTFSFT